MSALDPIEGSLGIKNALHLLSRTTFGYTKSRVEEVASKTAAQAISELFSKPVINEPSPSWLVTDPDIDVSEDLQITKFKCWLLEKMHVSSPSGFEKYIYFLHTHFTTISSVVGKHAALYYQNALFRYYGTGSVKTLAEKICADNAMMLLLDGNLNDKDSPNENFAREYFELYTIGKGPVAGEGDYTNYTELDIKEAAKVFSGYKFDNTYSNIDPDTNLPKAGIRSSSTVVSDNSPATRHDSSDKIFSPRFDNKIISPSSKVNGNATVGAVRQELKELIEMTFSKRETALNFCRKLYRFYVYYNITAETETSVIGPLAELLIAGNYNVAPVLEKLLSSQHFFDSDNSIREDDARGAIIKSPLEVTLNILIYFKAIQNPTPHPNPDPDFNSPYKSVLDSMKEQGMDFYEPLDVAGYDAYSQGPYYNRNWISANYLAYRYKFPQYLIHALNPDVYYGFYIDIVDFVKQPGIISDPSNATAIVRDLVETLLPEPITEARFAYFKNLFLDEFGDLQWNTEWNKYIINGDDIVVRKQLEVLYWTLLKSPEFQLH